jgi:hypothetical protein
MAAHAFSRRMIHKLALIGTRNSPTGDVAFCDIASFCCGAEFGRYRGIADMAGLAPGSTRSRMTPVTDQWDANRDAQSRRQSLGDCFEPSVRHLDLHLGNPCSMDRVIVAN